MKAKTTRLLAIKKIISSEKIGRQEELLTKLKEEGFIITQATLSRDLKNLQASRFPDPEMGYIYVLTPPTDQSKDKNSPGQDKMLLAGFLSIGFSSNLAVIRTLPGYAHGIAIMIDKHNRHEILGTVAGDDTVLVIPAEGATRMDIINALSVMEPKLSRLI